MNQTRRLAEELFQQAADLPPDQRMDFLHSKSGLDLAVRLEVEKLLARLEKSAIPSLAAVDQLEDEQDKDLEGEFIGDYKILQLIGEGGFGVVYMAEQLEPIRRKVALKIIKLGMDTKQIIARFEAERQALAMMDHPNIARVFEAGATDTGRPYFVMELVRGIPLTEYCDKNHLSTRARLELFIQVCRAVQHAHTKGVIHRDLKPSNIMITLHDGVPVPKVIDFGIARATDQPLTDKTVFTRFGQFIGTPQYMSPEQAVISGLDIDTRTDIYSLGVLLYELLTGTTPFDPKTLREASIGEMQRIIREDDPVHPSQRISTLGRDKATTAAARQAEPRTLSRLLRGELDWIVMKALEKDRKRRYETALALASDVERHLLGEPVLAGPPSRIYRFRKLVTRNKVTFGFLAILFVLITGFCIWMGVLYTQANQLRLRAEEERLQAERARDAELQQRRLSETNLERALEAEALSFTEAETAREVLSFLVAIFEVADTTRVSADSVTVREILDSGAKRIYTELEDQPIIQATLMYTIGQVYTNLGLYDRALPLLEEAYEIRCREEGEEEAGTLYCMVFLGRVLMLNTRLPEAEATLRKAVALCRRNLDKDDRITLKAVMNLAWVLQDQGHLDEAEKLAREALDTSRRILGKDHQDTMSCMNTLAWLLQNRGKFSEAEALSREVLELTERGYGSDQHVMAKAVNILGAQYAMQGKYEKSEPLLRQALEIRSLYLGDDHNATLESMANLADTLFHLNRLDEAEQLYQEALDGAYRIHGDDHRHTVNWRAGLGRVYLKKGRQAAGMKLLNDALEGMGRVLGEDHPDTLRLTRLMTYTYDQQGNKDKAESLLRHYIGLLEAQDPIHLLNLAEARGVLGSMLIKQARYEEAEAALKEAYNLIHGDSRYRDFEINLCEDFINLYTLSHKPDEAEIWQDRLDR